MKRLIVVGACYLDTILSVPYFPGEDEKLRASSKARRRGGNGPNTLEVLQQLVKYHIQQHIGFSLCSVLPAKISPAVQEIKASLGGDIDLSLCIFRPEQTDAASSYIIRSQQTGSRTIVNYNELPEMTVDEFAAAAEKVKTDDCWFHFEGRIPETIFKCIRYLRRHLPRSVISVELEKPGRPGLRDLAAESNVVFFSKSWAQHQGYKSASDCIFAEAKLIPQPARCYCTWGSEGAASFYSQLDASNIQQSPAFLPEGASAVDSTGAGDTFIAATLFCIILELQVSSQSMLDFAVKLAGYKVAQEGFDGLGQLAQLHMPEV